MISSRNCEGWYNQDMRPTRGLIEVLEQEDVELARAMTMAQKFRAGGDLFDEACRWTMAGIQRDYPHYSEIQVLEELRRRLEVARQTEGRL